MSPEDKFRFLLQMAAADESITREELRLLGQRALSLGITDDQFQTLLEEAIRGDVQPKVPDDRDERIGLLTDLVRMMGADGVLHEQEKRLFASIAAQTDIDNEKLNEIIDTAIINREPND